MNSAQAKKLPLPEIMSRLGYEPVKITKGGNAYQYRSPFRKEKDASFFASYLGGKWIWNDFGDIGGTVIDFVMRHENHTSVSEALRFLESMFQGPLFDSLTQRQAKPSNPDLFSFKQQAPQNSGTDEDDRQLELISASKIENPVIYSYLKGRGIPSRLVDYYLKEVRYRNKATGREYFAFGMENRSGGYEIRGASDTYKFKSVLIIRDITLIKGMDPECRAVNIFEGMTDFLSLLVMLNTDKLMGDALIMHSVASLGRTIDAIRESEYTSIRTFLDNNKTGEQGTQGLAEAFGDLVISHSSNFLPYEDLNDALKANANIRWSGVGE